jgi:hypothetical protein
MNLARIRTGLVSAAACLALAGPIGVPLGGTLADGLDPANPRCGTDQQITPVPVSGTPGIPIDPDEGRCGAFAWA